MVGVSEAYCDGLGVGDSDGACVSDKDGVTVVLEVKLCD